MRCFALLEDTKSNPDEKKSLYFVNHKEEIICHDPGQLSNCLDFINELQQKKYYLVGFVSYEASYFLDTSLAKNYPYKNKGDFPLLHFLAFDHCQHLSQHEAKQIIDNLTEEVTEDSFAYNIALNIDDHEYENNFNQIKQHLYDGNTYQVNYTGKYTFNLQGNPIKLYQDLRVRQSVEYGALLHFNDYQILSCSPELFFSKQGNKVTTKPMKGTMPRSLNPEIDAKNIKALTSNDKLIAENIIVVDLLRNDLSTISEPGSVSVSNLLQVETYETLHQMTSTIQSRVKINTPFKTFLDNLFPCGSITGAPKKRTMQIIYESEKEPRNIYTGAIGYITPENDMCFNVAIRTLLTHNNKGELGVGGGIVNDSTAEGELKELKLKARFFTEMDFVFKLIESIKYTTQTGYFLLDKHLQRLKRSALLFNFAYDENRLIHELKRLIPCLSNISGYKVRIILDKKGGLDLNYAVLNENKGKRKRLIQVYEAECVYSDNILLNHKTIDSSVRQFYDKVMSLNHGKYDEIIFINENGQVTEGSKSNIFIQYQGKILTPRTECGLLPGTMRNYILEKNPLIEETLIYLDDLYQAEYIWITNSVRGIEEVSLCKN